MKYQLGHKHPEQEIYYVQTERGMRLPIIDITHPAFAINLNLEQLDQLAKISIIKLMIATKVPMLIQRWAASFSPLVAGTLHADGTYLSGMATYLYKLGPHNLPRGYCSFIDRQMAAGIGSVAVRMRLQDLACLQAEYLQGELRRRPAAPLHLINISGGPSMDSINAFLLLGDDLINRDVHLHILDCDEIGPNFGLAAIKTMQQPEAPFSKLKLTANHIPYNWSDITPFKSLMQQLKEKQAIVLVASEGGLFEYGSDEDILAHLQLIKQLGPGIGCAGTVVRNSSTAHAIKKMSGMSIRPMALESIEQLLQARGFGLTRTCKDNPMYYSFNAIS
jgi:hypothetical protein